MGKGRTAGLDTLRKRILAEQSAGPPPECPDWLDPIAKAEWARIVPMIPGGLLPTDRNLLAAYCQAASQWQACEEKVRAEGITFADHKGNLKLHPAASHAARLQRQMADIAARFGFSPVSRARANLPTGASSPEEDEFNKFQKGGK